MRPVEIVGAFLVGLVAIAAISVLVKSPNTAGVVGAFGKAVADDIGAAKA